MPTELSTVDAIALLAELVAAGSRGSGKSMTRCLGRLRLLRRWARLRAARPDATEAELFARVAREAKRADPAMRVSGRTIRHWRDDYNRIGPGGLAAGPAGVLDRYRSKPI
ncbi:MAG TPA: hypothetical protein VM487_10510 [Phycisphaerae bacterium]|nr:hypothetical protein [Phycisphaerae bacterium]